MQNQRFFSPAIEENVAKKINGHSLLITGGTGSFGKQFVQTVLERFSPKRLVIFSRDELKQFEMRQRFSDQDYPAIRYFIGDVRDKDRLYRALGGIDIVIHAAALKQVPTAEYNPFEAVKTNIMGAANVIDAAIDQGVKQVIGLSTDKAANPINLYGATKLAADKLFVAGNNYGGRDGCRFSVVRYGNVIGSRGSVIPFFLKMREQGKLPITDAAMTRFWITLKQGVDFVLMCLSLMQGGEIYIPKIPSMTIMDLAKAIAPEAETEIVGIRPGEKMHEILVPQGDARHTLEFDDHFVIMPDFHEWDQDAYQHKTGGKPCAPEFSYTSDHNSEWLTEAELKDMIGLGKED